MNIENIFPYVIQACFGIFGTMTSFIITYIYNSKKKERHIEKNIKLSLISLIKLEIIKEYNSCINKGYCSIETITLLEDVYKSYNILGGNGTAKKLINEIKKLPLK